MIDKPRIFKLLEAINNAYYCEFCHRHIYEEDGVFVHDDVKHPENYIYGEGHKIQ